MDIKATHRFKRSLKRLKNKHYPINLLVPCIDAICMRDEKILTRIKDHGLRGKWNGFREFHPARIANNSGQQYDQWIVVYQISDQQLILTLIDTGNHEILRSR